MRVPQWPLPTYNSPLTKSEAATFAERYLRPNLVAVLKESGDELAGPHADIGVRACIKVMLYHCRGFSKPEALKIGFRYAMIAVREWLSDAHNEAVS